MTEQQTSVHV